MISEPTVFSFISKTTVLADELYVLSETKKIWCFVAILEEFSQNCSDNFALLAFYLNVIKTRSQGN